MRRYKNVIIFIVGMLLLWIGSVLIISIDRATCVVAADDTITAIPMLSRQEQIQLMKECLDDAKTIAGRYMMSGEHQVRASVAAAFFEYRTR